MYILVLYTKYSSVSTGTPRLAGWALHAMEGKCSGEVVRVSPWHSFITHQQLPTGMAGRGGGGVGPVVPSFDFLTAGSIQFGSGKLAGVR